MSFKLSYALRGLASHLFTHQDWPRLFDLLETKPFLADQAEQLGGFQASGEDLETYALPAAIEVQDWQRFLHYAALALNLRGLAEDLAAPEILRALARSSRASLDLALDAADRLANPFRQARALAAIASGCEDGSERDGVLRELEGRLDDLAREAGGQAEWAKTLTAVARDVGPDFQARWTEWAGRLTSTQVAQIWRAVAEGWLQRGHAEAVGLWQALEAIREPSLIVGLAPAGLGALNLERPAEILRRLEALLPDPLDRQRAGATLLGELARQSPKQAERACAAWEEWSTHSALAWSADLVDRGRGVLGRLNAQRIEEIAASLQDPSAYTALRVVVLEARRTSEAAAAALDSLRNVPDGPEKLHWSLRYLSARPAKPQEEIRRQVLAAGRYLQAIGFAAEIRDLARWLDLVALHLPQQLGPQLDAVLWSTALLENRVPALAEAATQTTVLDLLIERAERTAAALSSTEAEGFALRKDLLIRAACRRCVLTRSLDGLGHIAERLLPEEEDELRELLAPQIALLSEDGPRLAEEVCAGIGDRRRRLVATLRSTPVIAPEILAPANLYAALAQVDILEDESRGLAALMETPSNPRDLLERIVLPIREPGIRTCALLRLARHTLAFEIEHHDPPDRLLPLELVRWLLTSETDEELAALTPEIAELGAGAGGARAIAEVQEAARQLAALETVAWPVRREALEDLLARVSRGLLTDAEAGKALVTILRLPAQLRPETARQKLNEQWLDILPLVIAAADRLPEKYLRPIRRALQESLHGFRQEAAFQKVFALCLASAEERTKAVDVLGTADTAELQALAYLLIRHAPHRIAEVAGRLPAHECARLALRLIRHGWLQDEAARALLPCVAGDASEAEADLWCGPEKGDEAAWIKRTALWIAGEAPSPSDPRTEPLRERLWRNPGLWRPALAWAVQDSLRRGRPHGEATLRTWLHTHLAPAPGHGRPQSLEEAERVEAALQRATRLGPDRRDP